jgi:hypothetical protein
MKISKLLLFSAAMIGTVFGSTAPAVNTLLDGYDAVWATMRSLTHQLAPSTAPAATADSSASTWPFSTHAPSAPAAGGSAGGGGAGGVVAWTPHTAGGGGGAPWDLSAPVPLTAQEAQTNPLLSDLPHGIHLYATVSGASAWIHRAQTGLLMRSIAQPVAWTATDVRLNPSLTLRFPCLNPMAAIDWVSRNCSPNINPAESRYRPSLSPNSILAAAVLCHGEPHASVNSLFNVGRRSSVATVLSHLIPLISTNDRFGSTGRGNIDALIGAGALLGSPRLTLRTLANGQSNTVPIFRILEGVGVVEFDADAATFVALNPGAHNFSAHPFIATHPITTPMVAVSCTQIDAFCVALWAHPRMVAYTPQR